MCPCRGELLTADHPNSGFFSFFSSNETGLVFKFFVCFGFFVRGLKIPGAIFLNTDFALCW